MAEHTNMDSVINVCFVFDEKFVDLFKVSLLSVDKNTKSPLDIFVVDCGICEASKKSIVEFTKKLKNVRSVTFGTPERISEIEALAIPKYFSSAIFYRLAIPKIFPKLERVIYLDCDTITIGDICELWEEDLHGRPIGIIEEEGNFFLPNGKNEYKKSIKAPCDHVYINSGVLLIDCEKFEESKIFERVVDVIKTTKAYLDCPEQDAMIICMDNDEHWPLSPRYNFLAFFPKSDSVLKTIEKPVIIHYAGLKKPMYFHKGIMMFLKKLHIFRKSTYFITKFWEYSDQVDKDKFSGKKIKITVKFIYKKLTQPIERFFSRILKKLKKTS